MAFSHTSTCGVTYYGTGVSSHSPKTRLNMGASYVLCNEAVSSSFSASGRSTTSTTCVAYIRGSITGKSHTRHSSCRFLTYDGDAHFRLSSVGLFSTRAIGP